MIDKSDDFKNLLSLPQDKLCVDCKHHVINHNGRWKSEKHHCYHPSYRTTDLVTGEVEYNFHLCYVLRSGLSGCAINGSLWESKD